MDCKICKGTGFIYKEYSLHPEGVNIVRELCDCGKSPQNFPKANAYSLLAEVRAVIQKKVDYEKLISIDQPWENESKYYISGLEDALKIFSEHFS